MQCLHCPSLNARQCSAENVFTSCRRENERSMWLCLGAQCQLCYSKTQHRAEAHGLWFQASAHRQSIETWPGLEGNPLPWWDKPESWLASPTTDSSGLRPQINFSSRQARLTVVLGWAPTTNDVLFWEAAGFVCDISCSGHRATCVTPIPTPGSTVQREFLLYARKRRTQLSALPQWTQHQAEHRGPDPRQELPHTYRPPCREKGVGEGILPPWRDGPKPWPASPPAD